MCTFPFLAWVRATLRCAVFTPAASLTVFLFASILSAGEYKFFDDGQYALIAADRGLIEPAVPVHHNGILLPGGNSHVIEIADQVLSTGHYPLTVVDLVANTFLRPTYQTVEGSTGTLATSVVGSASFRTGSEFAFIPTVSRSDVVTTGPDRYVNTITAHFAAGASMTTTRTWNDPVIGRTDIGLSIAFETDQDIALAAGAPFPANDRMRVVTVSSMFSSETVFDANVIRYEDAQGQVRSIHLTNQTPRASHILPIADEIGSWIELVKGPSSTWNADSSTIRLDVIDADDLRLGIQAFLDNSSNCTDDSLSLWLEWIDAPDTLLSGTSLDVQFSVSATPPRVIDGLSGDFDGDSDVDGADFLVWQQGFGTMYDGDDFLTWQQNFGTSGSWGGEMIPEPASSLVALLATCLVWTTRTRRPSGAMPSQ